MLRKFIIDLVKYAPSKLLPAFSGFITIPIISRLFSPHEFGEYILAVSTAGLLYATFCSGLGSAVLRFYPEYQKRAESGKFFLELNVLLLLSISISGALAFLVLSFLNTILSSAFLALLKISILVFLVDSIFNVYLDILRAKEKSGSYTAFDLLGRYGSLGIGLLLIFSFGFGVEGLLWGNFLISLILIIVLSCFFLKGTSFQGSGVSFSNLKDIFQYAWPLGVANLSMWSLSMSDRYILNHYRSENEVGFYSMGYQVSEKTISIIITLFLLTLRPLINNTWVSGGRSAAEEAITMVTRIFLIFSLPACIGLTIIADPLMRILTTEAYYKGSQIVGFVAFSGFFWGLSQIAISGLILAKRTRLLALNQFVATALNLGLNFIFVPKYGFVGAGATTLLGYIVLFVLQTYQSKDELRWCFPFKTLRNVAVASVFMTFSIYLMRSLLNNWNLLVVYLFVAIFIGSAVYAIFLILLGELSRKEISALLLLKRQ